MSDPFESLLADALSAPDFELGHEMRRHLLAAAVPAGKLASDHVVPFEVLDSDAAAGFDWLVGDAPATRSLIRRMTRDPGFLALLDDERRFLRSLRRSLRRPTARVPQRRSQAVLAAAVAALALAAGTFFAFRGARPVATASVAMAGSSSPPDAVSQRAVVATPPDPRVASSTRSVAFSHEHASPQRGVKWGAPVVGGFAGSSDAWSATPSEVTSLAFCLETAAAATFANPEYGFATMDISPESPGSLLASNDISWSGADFIAARFTLRQDQSFFEGESGTSVPEPGGVLPMLIGGLMLLLHRPKREKSGR